MAQDATGAATSPDNIPTYNTAVDNPSGKGSNAQMAAIQTALSARVSPPAGVVTGEGVVWNGTTWARSSVTKLASGNFGPVVNADIDPAAAIAASKLAAYPSNGAVFLAGDGTWKSAGLTTYRKASPTVVNTSVAETDLFGAAITIAANALGATGVARITAWGNYLNNTGAAVAANRWKLKLGASTLIDTGAPAATILGTGTARGGWWFSAIIQNSATNVQAVGFNIHGQQGLSGSANLTPTPLTTGNGVYVSYSSPSGGSGWEAQGDNTSAVDTTASQALVFSVINPSASVSFETKLIGALVEIL